MSNNRLVVVLWVNAALLAAVVVALFSRPSMPQLLPVANAQVQQPIAGGAGLFLMPGQFSQNTWGCYVMDVDSQTLCAYQFFPGEKQLRLIAARNFRYDRRLANYNTTPAPMDVKDLLDKEAQTQRVNGQGQ